MCVLPCPLYVSCPALHSMCVFLIFTAGFCRVGEHPLVRVSLHPPLEGQLQLGSTLAGTLDFRFSQSAAQQDSAAPKCVQVVVMLETEERVQDQWQAPSKRQVAPIRKVNMRCVLIGPSCCSGCAALYGLILACSAVAQLCLDLLQPLFFPLPHLPPSLSPEAFIPNLGSLIYVGLP